MGGKAPGSLPPMGSSVSNAGGGASQPFSFGNPFGSGSSARGATTPYAKPFQRAAALGNPYAAYTTDMYGMGTGGSSIAPGSKPSIATPARQETVARPTYSLDMTGTGSGVGVPTSSPVTAQPPPTYSKPFERAAALGNPYAAYTTDMPYMGAGGSSTAPAASSGHPTTSAAARQAEIEQARQAPAQSKPYQFDLSRFLQGIG